MDKIKLSIARAQLGTALHLFIQNKDPTSVHCLACGGCEIIEGLAEKVGKITLTTHILKTRTELKKKDVAHHEKKYWNALKHFYERDNKTARDDSLILKHFSDMQNDTVLFKGWHDYGKMADCLPVEAQVFQVWWYALYEEKLNPREDPVWRDVFPNIKNESRKSQKRQLRQVIKLFKKDSEILSDPRTGKKSLLQNA